MPAPLITVLMPVYNAAQVVQRAIESIRRQTLQNWELVCVDDGSTDETPAVLEKLTRTDERMRVIRVPHGGIVGALNAGLEQSLGRFMARMDADDESFANRLEAQMSFLKSNPDIGLVSSLVEYGGDRAGQGGYALHVDWMNTVVTAEAIEVNRFVESPFAHPSVMFRRELVDRHGGYREGGFPEDYELWLRWLDAGVRMAKVPEPLLRWNDPPDRLSRTDARYDVEAFFRMKAAYIGRWLERNVDPGRRILVWGAGRPTRRRARHLNNHGVKISGYVDIDPGKIGKVLDGCPVMGPDSVPDPREAFVLGYVGNRGARAWMQAQLADRHYVEGRDFLMAA